MPLREQLERGLRLTLLVFVLAAAGFVSAVTAIRIGIRGRVVTMPNVIGQQVGDAERSLAADRLQLRVVDRLYSSLPVNTVVQQSPAAGEQVKVSQDARVILSLGPQTVKVPPLEGFSMRAGRIALIEAGLQLGEVSTVYLNASDPDSVLAQKPPPGSVATRPSVDVLVSAGPPVTFYVMPVLVGLTQPDAMRILSAAGLHVTATTHVAQAGAPKDTVIGQTPSGGSRVMPDTLVELGVAD